MTKNQEIARNVLEAIGGKDNVSAAAHCMTRLRLNLKDESKFNEEMVKSVDGVIGINKVGVQYQIIIGQNVDKVYEEFCKLAEIKAENAIDENLDTPKEKPSVKKLGSMFLDYLSVSMFSVAPILMIGGLCKAIAVILGPNMANVISDTSNFYILMTAVYNACFYFLPIFVGYTASKKLKLPEFMGLVVGAIIIVPDLVSLAGTSFSVYGIPTTLYDYNSTIMPVLLSMLVVNVVYKFINKRLPDAVRNFDGFLTMMVTLPIILCACAPVGNYLGNAICDLMMSFYNTFGVFAVVFMCAFSTFLTMTGMHVALGTISAMQIITTAYDPFYFVAGMAGNFTMMGMAFASSIKIKDKKEKSNAFGYFVSAFLGGVTEPALYGLAMKYKKPFIGIIGGGAITGLFCGLTGVAVRMLPPTSNFLGVVAFFGDSSSSVYCGIAAAIIAFVSSAVLTYLFGYKDVEIEAR